MATEILEALREESGAYLYKDDLESLGEITPESVSKLIAEKQAEEEAAEAGLEERMGSTEPSTPPVTPSEAKDVSVGQVFETGALHDKSQLPPEVAEALESGAIDVELGFTVNGKWVTRAEAEATRAQLEAENSRSNALIAMELEKARLEAMPKIVAEMVKPAEKISAIHVNHMTGFGGGIRESGDRAEKTVMGHTMDSIMEMAVQMPVLRKIGDQLGVDFDQSLNPKKSDEDS